MGELFCPGMNARQHIPHGLACLELCQVVFVVKGLQLGIPLQQAGCIAQVASLSVVPVRKVLPVSGFALCQLAVAIGTVGTGRSQELWSTLLQGSCRLAITILTPRLFP